MNIIYNYSKLRGLIRENGLTQKEFAKAIGISATQLYERFGNRVHFDQVEMDRAMELFKLPITQLSDVFFVKQLGDTNE